MSAPRTLAELAKGESARITAVAGEDAMAVRLLEMGFLPGATVTLMKTGLFGDPMQLRLRGYHVLLRRQEAARVGMEAR